MGRRTLMDGRVEYIPVRLKSEWMGNAKGTELMLNYITANQLIARRAAVEVLDGGPDETEVKEVVRPVKDKMVRRPQRSKSLT